MKKLAAYILLLITFNLNAKTKKVEIEPNQTLQLSYEEFSQFNVKIKNSSSVEIDVSVNEKVSGKKVKGFGLPSKNSAVVRVEDGRELRLINNSNEKVTIELSFIERKVKKNTPQGPYIKFTLRNGSGESIPLIIPNVMNPNLSPYSNSGVSLMVGQEILFKYKGKKRVLFVVTEDIKEGDKIEVSSILERRMKEIDAK